MDLEQFGRDLERVASLARTFYGHRDAIRRLEDVSTSQGKDLREALLLASSWIGYHMARIWPQGPWQPSAVNDLVRGVAVAGQGQEDLTLKETPRAKAAKAGKAAKPAKGARSKGSPADTPADLKPPRPANVPRPPDELLAGLTADQQRFVAFAFGVIGGISNHRPVHQGPLGSIVELAQLLAPLVCVPADAWLDEHTVSDEYIQQVAAALGLDVDELIALANRLGLTLT